MIDWVMDSSHWLGEEGAITLIMQHVVFSVITLGLSLVIAFPVGCYVGHTGRGRVALVGMANALRALPSFGLIILLVILCGPLFESDLAFIVPCLVVLMVLALPPIMVGAIQSADKPVWICAAQTELAHAVAWDLRTRFRIAAQVVTGDAAAWQAAGWPLVEDDASLAESERSDFLFWLHDRHSGNLQASRDYLAWEASLPAAVAREGGHGFRRLGPGGRTNEESCD